MDLVETLRISIMGIIEGFVANLPRLAGALIVVAIFIGIAGLVERFVRRLARLLPPSLQLLFGRLAYIGALLLGVMLSLGFFNITIGQMFASLGVAGVVIGFAFKDILQNFIAGVLILWRQPFVVGDRISSSGIEGVVGAINFRSTVIVTDEDSYAYVPNGKLFTEVVINHTPHAHDEVKLPKAEGREVQS